MVISLHPDFALEQTLKRPHHNTWLSLWATHCISLTRACLPIGENADIEAIKCALNSHFRVLIDVFLSTLSSKAGIELELFDNYRWIFNFLVFFELDLECELILYRAYLLAAHVAFVVAQRPDPAINPDFTFNVLDLVMKPFTFHAFKLEFEPYFLILFSSM